MNRAQRQIGEAQNRFERAISNYRRTGDYLGEGLVRIVIADLYRRMQRPNEAREMVLEGIDRFKQAGRRVGVSELICQSGLPAPLPDDVIDDIRRHEDEHGYVVLGEHAGLKKGDKVRITDGAMADHV